MGAKGAVKPEEVEDLPVEAEDVSTHQEAIPIPFLCGTNLIALRWLGPAENMITRQAKDQAGKK